MDTAKHNIVTLRGISTECTIHQVIPLSYSPSGSLVPRPSIPPVFDCLQYAKTEREGLGNLTPSEAQLTSRNLDAIAIHILYTAT